MKKKTDRKMTKFMFGLASVSAVITLAEGMIYYNATEYPDVLLRWMLIIQNMIKAFGFRTDIGLADLASALSSSQDALEIVIGYAYAVAIFTAPYCTIAFLYQVLERFFNFRNWRLFHLKKKGCIFFGYNEEVKALIGSYDEKKGSYRIHVVAPDIGSEDEIELLRKGIILHKIDCIKMKNDQLEYFFKQMELKHTEKVILFEESSARNFSLYQMFREFQTENAVKVFPEKTIKFFCRCEDDGIRRILEDYHDDMLKKADTEQQKENEKCMEALCSDLEVISVPELRIRKILKQKPLHQYYLNKLDGALPELGQIHAWDLHLLIIGFGKLGQQLLLQAMSQGVVSSGNKMTIDVIDSNIDEKASIFVNNFHESYIKQNAKTKETEIEISGDEVDGKLQIRFHKMDIRYQQFYQQLLDYGDELYTYISICVEDMDVSLHCMSQIQRYLRNYEEQNSEKNVPLAIRMEYDKKMANFLNKNQKSYVNVVAVEETSSALSLEELLHHDIDEEAKDFNLIYNTMDLKRKVGHEEVTGRVACQEFDEKRANDYWRELTLFRRNSNRALAFHQTVKRMYLGETQKQKISQEINSLLKNESNTWFYGCEEDAFAKKQSEALLLGELSKMEHRRWCYYMISCGWTKTKSIYDKKDDLQRKNPCICPWEELLTYKPEMCKYDLMPVLVLQENDNPK